MNKKICIIIFLFIILFAIPGCGRNEGGSTTPPDNSGTGNEPPPNEPPPPSNPPPSEPPSNPPPPTPPPPEPPPNEPPPPTPPPTTGSMTLEWDPNTETTLAGYKMYYGTSSRTYSKSVDVYNVTMFTIKDLIVGQVYYIAVTAYDIYGNESDFSNEVFSSVKY